jgi:membrane protein
MKERILKKINNWLITRYGEFRALRIIVLLIGIKDLIVATFSNWIDDDIPLHGAALAFYTIFSLAPLLIIIIAVTGFIFGEQAATGQVSAFLDELVGVGMATIVENIISGANHTFSNVIAAIIGIGTILFTSTTVITQLKSSLNTIWNVETKEGNTLRQFFISRFTSFLLVMVFALTLVSSLIFDAILQVINTEVSSYLPEELALISLINYIVFVVATVLLFTIIFRMLPDIKIAWVDALIGASVTTLLFMAGRFVITLFFGIDSIGSTYGTAGTFVVILVWIYYNSMTVFLGAEFTHQYTIRYGSGVTLPKHARFKK